MRRRRLPSRRRATSLAVRESSTDLKYLEEIVTIQFPIAAARSYLTRSLGNPIRFQLCEVQRGETVGVVREIEVRHANGGDVTWIRGERVLANGEPASFFVPDHLVRVRPIVEGAGAQNRSLSLQDEVVLHVPVRGYLRYLPGLYQGGGPVSSQELVRAADAQWRRWGSTRTDRIAREMDVDGDPMRRFLFIFQHVMTSLTDKIDRIVDLCDPLLCDPRFLPWLASWVSFELDESLPVHQQRELVRRAIRLYRTRGTRRGIEDMIRVLTAAPVRIMERQRPAPVVLGKNSIVGGRDVVHRYIKNEPPGAYLVDPYQRTSTSFFALVLESRTRFETRFGERGPAVLRRIVHVVSQEKPSHIAFTVHFDSSSRS